MKALKRMAYAIIFVAILSSGNLVNAQEKVLIDNFEEGRSEKWATKSFHNETVYETVTYGDGNVLQATSNGSASCLIFEREFDINEYPILTWRWKVENTVERGDFRQKSTDDFAARVFVMFPHWYFPKTTSVNYIWANLMPKEESHPSVHVGNAVMIAVESGKRKVGEWVEYKRNIVEDYRRAFGRNPPVKAIIAIMTDTDNTGDIARAWYDDIYLMRQ